MLACRVGMYVAVWDNITFILKVEYSLGQYILGYSIWKLYNPCKKSTIGLRIFHKKSKNFKW